MEYLEKIRLNEDRNMALGVALNNFVTLFDAQQVSSLLTTVTQQFYVPTAVTDFVGAEIVELFQNEDGTSNNELMMAFHRFHAYLWTVFGDNLEELHLAALAVYTRSSLNDVNNLIVPKLDDSTKGHIMTPGSSTADTYTRLTRTNEMKVIYMYLALWDGTIPE